jgi:hypothetical protein
MSQPLPKMVDDSAIHVAARVLERSDDVAKVIEVGGHRGLGIAVSATHWSGLEVQLDGGRRWRIARYVSGRAGGVPRSDVKSTPGMGGRSNSSGDRP